MIRAAIIGCGKIADKHAGRIHFMPDARLVGVCDRDGLMAEQVADRFGVPHAGVDAQELLRACQPDVVHITTPPRSHFALAQLCIAAGHSVYVEKPFTVTAAEARELVALAERSGAKLTVGHDTQFAPVACDMRALIRGGYIGERPTHMDSKYCYDFGDARYAKALLGDKNHWVRSLPGGLLHNIISHGIGKIVEYLADGEPTVIAHGSVSRFLRDLGETDIIDELRVIIQDREGSTAYFTFSSQIAPPLHEFTVYGKRNGLSADFHHQTLIRIPGTHHKSYLNQFVPPFRIARQYAANGRRNIRRFLGHSLHMDAGIQTLIRAFYDAVAHNAPLPIPYRDIVLTTQIMDRIFEQIGRAE